MSFLCEYRLPPGVFYSNGFGTSHARASAVISSATRLRMIATSLLAVAHVPRRSLECRGRNARRTTIGCPRGCIPGRTLFRSFAAMSCQGKMP